MSKIPPPLIELRGISKGFPGVQALSDVSLTLHRGEVHALVGENGAGKSTLMNVLAGELQPNAGEILIDGHPLRLNGPVAARAQGIAVVFQELSLCPNLTVAENVMLTSLGQGRPLGPVDRRAAAARAAVILAQLGMPDLDPETRVRDLTVARMQLVEIARAISLDARVLILDEPNSALSPRESDRLFDVVRGLRAKGVAVVLVSHHLREVLQVADRVTVLRDGRFASAWDSVEGLQEKDLVAAMVGRDLAQLHRAGPSPQRGRVPAMRLRDFSVKGAIHSLDLELQAGEILGVAGLPDGGKDVLAEAVFGLMPRGGTVEVGGRLVPSEDSRASIAAGLALAPADRRRGGALLLMNVAQNVVSSSLSQVSRLGWLQGRRIAVLAGAAARRLDARISGLGQRMETLSGGNQQKIVLARGLATNPRVLILHEPTRGVDVGAKAEIYAILRGLAADGMAILMISSELPEIVTQCHRVIVVAGGGITGEFQGLDITEEALMTAATAFSRVAA